MRISVFRGIELFAQKELIVLRLGGQAMHNNLTAASLATALAAGAVYHFAVLAAIAAVLA
jgi:hypothetical protein